MSISFGIDNFGAFMAKMDRGAGKKELKEVFVGKRVYSRFYGNGTITKMEDDKLYVHFDEGQDRICYMKYLQEEM